MIVVLASEVPELTTVTTFDAGGAGAAAGAGSGAGAALGAGSGAGAGPSAWAAEAERRTAATAARLEQRMDVWRDPSEEMRAMWKLPEVRGFGFVGRGALAPS
jgi:hypothetical protein